MLSDSDKHLTLDFYFQPWLVTPDHPQALVSCLNNAANTGFEVLLSTDGEVQVAIGTGSSTVMVSTGFQPVIQRWCQVKLQVEGISVTLECIPLPHGVEPAEPSTSLSQDIAEPPRLDASVSFLLAASEHRTLSGTQNITAPSNFFNGRLDSVKLSVLGPTEQTIFHYDFSLEIPSDTIVDVSGNRRNGVLVNAPSRAVLGHDWDGSQNDWTKARSGYGAIHFHEDDLDDACWETDFDFVIPEDARSGVYSVELTSQARDVSELVLFFVRPSPRTTEKVRLAQTEVTFTLTSLAPSKNSNCHVYFHVPCIYQRPPVGSIDKSPSGGA